MNNRKFISQWEKIFCNKNIRIISIGEHYHIHPKAIRYQVSPRSAHAPAQANSPIQFKLFSAAATLVSLVEKSRQPQHDRSSAPGLNCPEFDKKIILRILTLQERFSYSISTESCYFILLFFLLRISFKMSSLPSLQYLQFCMNQEKFEEKSIW